MTFSRRTESAWTKGRSSGTSTVTGGRSGPRLRRLRLTTSSSRTTDGWTDKAPACIRLMASSREMRSVSRSVSFSMEASSSARSASASDDVGLPQRRHSGLDARQRCSQIMADGGQQGGPYPVSLRQLPCPLGFAAEAAFLEYPRRGARQCLQQHAGRRRGARVRARASPARRRLPPAGSASSAGRHRPRPRTCVGSDCRTNATLSSRRGSRICSSSDSTEELPISIALSPRRRTASLRLRSAVTRCRAPTSTATLTSTAITTKTTSSTALVGALHHKRVVGRGQEPVGQQEGRDRSQQRRRDARR